MLKRSFAIAIILAIGASAFPQKITFLRTYTMGDKDVYVFSMTMDVGQTMTSTGTETQEVTKVYDDGSADIALTVSNMKVKLGDKDLPVPDTATPPMVMRLDKYGRAKDLQLGGGDSMSYIYSAMSGLQGGIAVGQSVPFDATIAKTKVESKGTITLVEVKDGSANLQIVLVMTKDGMPSGHMDGNFYMITSSSKLSKMDFILTMPDGKQSHMTMTRQAS